MISPLKASILLPIALLSIGIGAVPTHVCRTAESSPLLSDCQIALYYWNDTLPGSEICVRDNRKILAEYGRCTIVGYNVDQSEINPNVPARNEYCFTKDIVRRTLRYLTWQCGELLPADQSPHGQEDVRIEGEYRFDSIDDAKLDRYRSIRVIDSDYEHERGIWAKGTHTSPAEYEAQRFNWEHRAGMLNRPTHAQKQEEPSAKESSLADDGWTEATEHLERATSDSEADETVEDW
ncbi:hypothetical protein BJ508DRAFT_345042 [Ascobolus immersus RN42]|uniref:Uncharacterized protein n=1 Tax=Ascobolus immersus RN42 TaxID=1160509 RepID=A0A3N4IR34_ASCIM|nr:hypothetical protein BJ508DRAFT_345042 [Ascobolus immersus RN42]